MSVVGKSRTLFLGEQGISTLRAQLWGDEKTQSKGVRMNTYVALQSAVAGFIQGSGDETRTVYCIDFSELFPLAQYNNVAAENFSFHGLLKNGRIEKSEKGDSDWKKLDLSIMNQLLFDTNKPICIANSHLQEMLRVTRAIHANLLSGRMTLDDIQAMDVDHEQLSRIGEWLQDVEKNKNEIETVKEYQRFIQTFIPSWTIDKIRDTARNAGSIKVFQAIYRESALNTFSDGERSIFSALEENDSRVGSKLDGFWNYMKGRDQNELYETVYEELCEVFSYAGGREDIPRADALALADLHMLNEYCNENNIALNFKLLTRTPYLLRAQAYMPQGLLNVVIRHPAIIPEIYGYSTAQIESAKELVGQISAAIAEYDKIKDFRVDEDQLEGRLARMIRNFTGFLINSNLVKDWTDDSNNDVANKISDKFKSNLEDDYNLQGKIEAFKRFFELLSKSLLQGESVIYKQTIADYKAIEKEAADDRLAYRISALSGVEIFCSKESLKIPVPKNNASEIRAYLITTPRGYMSPGFRVYDETLIERLNFIDSGDTLFDSLKIGNLDKSRKVWKLLDDLQVSLERKYGFLNWSKVKYCFKLMRGGDSSLSDSQLSYLSKDENKRKEIFEKVLIEYLSLFQMKAYYYAVLMQHRYAAIICSEAIRTLSGSNSEIAEDIEIFEKTSKCFDDRRILLCFKELFLLRQYCERAHGFDKDSVKLSNTMSHEMAEVVLQKDKPYLHFARADRDLHYADLCHRSVINGTIHEAVEYQFDDVRIPLCRHAGYLENYLKEMLSIDSVSELFVGMRRMFWATASNASSLDKLSKYLRTSLEEFKDSSGPKEYSNEVAAYYLNYQISRAYHINITVFMVLLSDSRITHIDAFWDPYKALRHVEILGFIQVFNTMEKYRFYSEDFKKNKAFSSKTGDFLNKFLTLLESIDGLRRNIRNEDGSDPESRPHHVQYLNILEEIRQLLTSKVPDGRRNQNESVMLRDRSFYTVLILRLIKRVEGKIADQKLL